MLALAATWLWLVACSGGAGLNRDAGSSGPTDSRADARAADATVPRADAAADGGPMCEIDHADCTSDPGCETQLGTADNCAACGDRACTLANTLLACDSADHCTRAVCAPGFANCDGTSADCESSFAAGGSCLPAYGGTTAIAGDIIDVSAAMGADGSILLSGGFRDTVDFDPTAGIDSRSTDGPGVIGAFITKINADGSYGWTKTFTDGNAVLGPAAGATGGAVTVTGAYRGSIDLDPGPGVDLHQAVAPRQQEGLIVKLAQDGSFVWGRTFSGAASDAHSALGFPVVDADDAVYVAGGFQSTVDFDPGAGTALRTSVQGSLALVKLTAAGAFSWVQTIGEAPCTAFLAGFALASDGAVWAAGTTGGGSDCKLGPPSTAGIVSVPFVTAYEAGGTLRGFWIPVGDRPGIAFTGLAAGAGGSVYLSGKASGVVDLDLGPGTAMRRNDSGGGFVLKLASDATFLWAETVPGASDLRVTAVSDGGVLGADVSGLITRLAADGTPRWSFRTTISPVSAARGNTFVVVGVNQGAYDLDPGAGVDPLSGNLFFASRFGL